MRTTVHFLLILVAASLMLVSTPTVLAANSIRFSDVSISLGDSRSDVTKAVLASKNHYSIRGGYEELLAILDAQGSLTAIVRFRKDAAIAIELVWDTKTAADLAETLRQTIESFIGDTGTLNFDITPNNDTVARLTSGNVDVSIRSVSMGEGETANSMMVFVTIGERREFTKR